MNHITKVAEMMTELVKEKIEGAVTLTAIEQITRQLMQEVGRETVEKTMGRSSLQSLGQLG